jgi:hypothetical protein
VGDAVINVGAPVEGATLWIEVFTILYISRSRMRFDGKRKQQTRKGSPLGGHRARNSWKVDETNGQKGVQLQLILR